MMQRPVVWLLATWIGLWAWLPSLAAGDAGRAPQASRGRAAARLTRTALERRSSPHPRRPWRIRRREGVNVQGTAETVWEIMAASTEREGELNFRELRMLGLRPKGVGLKDLDKWPEEPAGPKRWDEDRFAAAFVSLCPAGLEQDVKQYARLVMQVSREHGTDPALLAALVYQQSHCDAGRETSWGFGLTQLNRGLLPRELASGVYPFFRATDAGWEATHIQLAPTSLSRRSLLDPYTNLNVAALQLRVLKQQCPALDRPYGAGPHRHFVSHFIYGDEVNDAGAEDRVLETRRRLLAYYNGMRAPSYVKLHGVVLVSPMDGAPRIATSGLGDDRDEGKRRHAGIDYLSRFGEPVRAVADGKVIYAGTDLANNRKVNVDPDRATLVPEESMGARGLFVELDHAAGLRSVYAHLSSYSVRVGDHVRRGQLLGYVGRSGIQKSDPHLHFGLFANGQVVDPLQAMQGLVFGPGDTVREPQPHGHEHTRRRRRRGPRGRATLARGERRGRTAATVQ